MILKAHAEKLRLIGLIIQSLYAVPGLRVMEQVATKCGLELRSRKASRCSRPLFWPPRALQGGRCPLCFSSSLDKRVKGVVPGKETFKDQAPCSPGLPARGFRSVRKCRLQELGWGYPVPWNVEFKISAQSITCCGGRKVIVLLCLKVFLAGLTINNRKQINRKKLSNVLLYTGVS